MSVVHRFCGTDTSYDWEDIISKEYKGENVKGASGKIMIGRNEGAECFVFRYFLIRPGGHSTLNDYHGHDHGVLILHGRALLTLGEKKIEIGPRDIAYIQPWEIHSLEALGDEPLGFLCVIPNLDMLARLQNKDNGQPQA